MRLLSLLIFLCSLGLSAQNPNGDNRTCQQDARISLAFSGDTVRNTCVDDDVMDRLRFQVVPFRQAFAYVVVDADDVIQFVDFTNFINFDMLPAGELKVYAFSNYGNIAVNVGDTFTGATLSEPCFGLTENFVTINNGATGDVTISSSAAAYDVCAGDGNADVITYSTDAVSPIYVITDNEGNVLTTTPDDSFDFEGADGGTCRIYALGGGLTIEAGENVSSLEGQGTCGGGLSGNFITVNREFVDGGTITTIDGAAEVTVCPGDDIDDIVQFTLAGAAGESTGLLITDENNIVVMIPPGLAANFNNTPIGVCRAWGVAYTGELVAEIGQQVTEVLANNECINVSDNFVLVTRTVPVGGSLTTVDGATEVQTCPGDGIDDLVEVSLTGSEGGEVIYVLTNDSDVILDSSAEPVFNLEGAPVGTCRIWAVTYRGNLTLTDGEVITSSAISDNCFSLSENFVTVVRAVPAGGTVATEAGETEINTCPGDGVDDFVTFTSTGAEASNFTYIVTDANGVILGIPPADSVNFEGAGDGNCRLYGLAYQGDLLATVDGTIEDQLASECFSLSDNFVTVIRELPSGGTVSLENGATETTICPGDGIADVLTFTSTGATGELFAFIITDDTGEILGFPASANVDFETIEPGVCRVYGLTYSGEITANVTDQVDEVQLATSCFALSDNFVTVNRTEATTGPVSLEGGGDEILVCPGDAIPDVVRFDSTGTTLENFNYLITDTNNVIIADVPFTDAINFENFPAGVCRVYGIGYDGLITAVIGQVVGVDQLATECSAVSDNFVTVTKQIPDGGSILTSTGEREVMVCSMDGIPDLVTAVSSSASGARFFFVLTTEDNTIITIQDEGTFDFEVAQFGVCRIWGLSFQGTLLVGPGDNIDTDQLAEGCADLSDDFVTVIRDDAAVGAVSTVDGEDIVYTCPGDDIADVVEFTVDGASETVIYLITTEQDTLLAVANDNSFDFNDAPEGICRVYALTFAGGLLAEEGTEVTTADLATGCFALSDNYVTVVREIPDGGTVSLEDGATEITFCSGDAEADVLGFATTSGFANYGYIIADDSIALTGITTDSFDLSNAFSGTYEIYGIAYTGNLTVAPGFNIFEATLSTDCWDLSDNFITANVTRVEGGNILGNGAEELYFCRENPTDGFVTFTSSSLISNENYVYCVVIDNPAQVVLSILEENTFDFGPITLERVKVVAISYTGDLLIQPGQSLTFDDVATGCVGFSSCVTVFNDDVEAGEVSVDGVPNGGTACVVDGNTNISVSTTSTSMAGYAVIVTDTFGIIQLVTTDPENVALGTLPEGPYRVYGLSYTGNVTALAGQDIAIDVLADNCYELTETFVAITRGGEITAGTLSNVTTDGGDTIAFCLAANDAPIAVVEPSINVPNYRYIVTDTDDRVIVANLQSNIIPFFGFQPGEYRIYGFTFTGIPNVGVNQVLTDAVLSTECYALTNFITVLLERADGGLVIAEGGDQEVTVEIDENGAAVVNFLNIAPGPGQFTFLITDENNVVLGTNDSGMIDFGPAGPGVCRVWGLGYNGELLAAMDMDATTDELATGCFNLSDGFVTVTRTDDDGLIGDSDIYGGNQSVFGNGSTVLSAFPNPSATGEIFITIESNLMVAAGQLTVRDMNGTIHRVQTIAGGAADATIRFDVSDLAPGMYFAAYVTAQGVQSLQFMKQ